MATGTWIYEVGSAQGGSGDASASIPDPPPVTIDETLTSVGEIENGQMEIVVHWKPDATANPDNFTGVEVYLEDPDISDKPSPKLDGTVKLGDATTPTTQKSGKWQPVHQTKSFPADDPDKSFTDLKIPGTHEWRPIRVYLLSFGPSKTAALIEANKPGPTPNTRIGVGPAEGAYVSGEEHAWLVSDVAAAHVDDFDDPKGPVYHLDFDFTAHDETDPLPKGLRPFAGVQIVYEYDDGTRSQGPFLQVNKPEEWHSPDIPIGEKQHFLVWFVSADIDGNLNNIVESVTPFVDVTVVYPPPGQATTPDVTGFAISNFRHEVEADGTDFALADLTWTPPDSNRFASVSFYRVDQQPPRLFPPSPLPANVNHTTLYVNDWPKISQNWTIAAIATDFNGQMSADPKQALPSRVPTVVWPIGPAGLGSTGSEYTAGVVNIVGVTITTEQQLNSDGVVMMRHKITGWVNPTDNSFGGLSIARVIAGNTTDPVFWDAAKTDTSLTTPWEPAPGARSWDFYFVSRDMAGRRNSLYSGVTPRKTVAFTPMLGDIVPSRLPSGWWNTDEFSWPVQNDPAVDFSVKSIVAPKIFVGSILRVGGGNATNTSPSFGGFQNGQVAVYNNANVLRAWMGQQDNVTPPAETTPRSVFGGWFAELYEGGDGPDTAPIYANQQGVVIVGGWDVKGSRYPYISIRNERNTEVARIGAKVATGMTGVGSEAVNLAGAWFQSLGLGGQSLADWRVLAYSDPSAVNGSNVSIRQLNKFTIDYQANYPSSTNPTNSAVHLEFGYDAFVAETLNPSYWKYPGLSLSVIGKPYQRLAIITRGIVAYGPDNYRKCAIYAWNGDQYGSDGGAQWWGEMTLYSTSNNAVVILSANAGGSQSNSSYLKMYDATASTLNFFVDGAGNVTIRGTLSIGGAFSAGALSVTSLSVTNNITAGGSISGNSLNLGSGNATLGSISASGTVSANVLAANSHTGGTYSGNSLSVSGGISGSSATISGAVIGGSLAVTGRTVIDAGGNFIGNAVNAGSNSISGGPITGTQYSVGGTNVINTGGVFVGNGVNTGGNGIAGGGFNPYVGGRQYYGTNYDSFPLQDGRTVHVRGGIVVKIGDATPP